MLVHLHVRNLALIEDIEVDFGPGLNILTGETGAGKSILLGSMQLILGSKPSRNLIRENASYALVELLFQVDEQKTLDALSSLDIEAEEGQILLSRRIMDGRSICKINGETCTVGQMKAAAGLLLDIHGQHEHQTLLQRDRQLAILDEFGGQDLKACRGTVTEAYHKYQKAVKARRELDIGEEERAREIAFLEFEIGEIENADLKPGEDEELEKRYRRLNNSRRITGTMEEVHGLSGTDGGAADLIGKAVHEIQRVTEYDDALLPLYSSLGDIDALLQDLNREISAYLDDLVFDEEEFYRTEQRLDLLNSMKARYGSGIEEILAYQQKQQEKLEKLERHGELLAGAVRDEEEAAAKLTKACDALTGLRKEYADKFAAEIRKGLSELNFLEVQFEIRFDRRSSFTEKGLDEVTYEISTNPGESIRPLSEIVSGGELSRIMLAIKTILADRDEIGTMIFDEIDAGISGRTAQKVSEKMAAIGRHRQVLCITHLPQIAAMADTHFEIVKHGDASGTVTEIHPLDEKAAVKELARLLGGATITEGVEQNAVEMKKLANALKQGL